MNIPGLRKALVMETYEHLGMNYIDFLSLIHSHLRPKTYLEVGVAKGYTLQKVTCSTIAVDPFFDLEVTATGARSQTLFFQMTSDEFFASNSPSQIFGRPIDFAFLDGLHESEALLRDFINTEQHCRSNSIIALHDCIPQHSSWASRAFDQAAWTGDVWKVVAILKEQRPDLKIFSFDAAPTGVVLITGLNPSSNHLGSGYFDIVEKWKSVDLNNYGFGHMIELMEVRSTSSIVAREDFSRHFW